MGGGQGQQPPAADFGPTVDGGRCDRNNRGWRCCESAHAAKQPDLGMHDERSTDLFRQTLWCQILASRTESDQRDGPNTHSPARPFLSTAIRPTAIRRPPGVFQPRHAGIRRELIPGAGSVSIQRTATSRACSPAVQARSRAGAAPVLAPLPRACHSPRARQQNEYERLQ